MIVDLSVDFSTSLNDTFITNIVMPKILQNLMALNNSVEIDGVKYSAAVDMIFEREVPRMNGSLISADNVTACTYCIDFHPRPELDVCGLLESEEMEKE